MMRSETTDRDISVEFLTSEHQPPFIKSDQYRFQQILLNLLSNAIKYNRPGGSVVVRSEMTHGDFLRISVSDNHARLKRSSRQLHRLTTVDWPLIQTFPRVVD